LDRIIFVFFSDPFDCWYWTPWKRILGCVAPSSSPLFLYSSCFILSSPCLFCPCSVFLLLFLCKSTLSGDEVTAGNPGRVVEVDVRNDFFGVKMFKGIRGSCCGFLYRGSYFARSLNILHSGKIKPALVIGDGRG
jgi:hypothetical protein